MRLALPAASLLAMLGRATAFACRRAAPAAFALAARRPSVSARPFSSAAPLRMAGKGGDDDSPPFPTWSFDEHCHSMGWTELASPDMTATADLADDGADLVIVGVSAPAKENDDDDDNDDDAGEKKDQPPPVLTGRAKELDEELGGVLSEWMAENAKAFKNGAKAGDATPTLRLAAAGSKPRRYVLLGVGREGEDSEKGTAAKLGAAIAARCGEEKGAERCSVLLPPLVGSEDGTLSELATGFYQALYSDNRYRTGDKVKHLAEDLKAVVLAAEGGISDQASADASVRAGIDLAKGVYLTKDIVNAPHNVLNSESLADTARRIAAESGGTITCKVLGKEECEERGMGAYLGVARGSETQPQFIHLTYTPPKGPVHRRVAVVGKGLLFDTGGYNIKVAMMELMKFDCGGAAAVLGAARAVAALAPPGVETHFVVAACENMINERAMVPSDVLTASNGKTIEVVNTDAEGRLTLADALVYADKEIGADSIIELSTLTGAMMVSLGQGMCGFFTADDGLAKELEDAAEKSGDKSWRMPMAREYNDQLKSKIADMTNCGTRYGGAITAALFLENFVAKKKPFAHIDIAGPVWSDKDGATGFGAKLVTEWVARQGDGGGE